MGSVFPRVTDVTCQSICVTDVPSDVVVTDVSVAMSAVLTAGRRHGNWQRGWQFGCVR